MRQKTPWIAATVGFSRRHLLRLLDSQIIVIIFFQTFLQVWSITANGLFVITSLETRMPGKTAGKVRSYYAKRSITKQCSGKIKRLCLKVHEQRNLSYLDVGGNKILVFLFVFNPVYLLPLWSQIYYFATYFLCVCLIFPSHPKSNLKKNNLGNIGN